MIENIVRHLSRQDPDHGTVLDQVRIAAHEVQRPVFYAIAIIITAYLPIFTLQQVEGKLVQADGMDGRLRAAGRAHLLDADCARAGKLPVSRRHEAVAEPRGGIPDGALSKGRRVGGSRTMDHGGGRGCVFSCARFIWRSAA